MAFLKTYGVLRSDHVGLPEVFIVIFTVPPPILRGEMIDIIKAGTTKQLVQLAVFADVGADIVGAITVKHVARGHFVAASGQLGCESSTDKSCASGDENPLRLYQGRLPRRGCNAVFRRW